MNGESSQRGRQFFFVLFIVLAILVLYLLGPYLSVIAIALVTVVLLKPLYDWFYANKRIRGRARIATTLTLVTFFLMILIPIVVIGTLFFIQANDLLEEVKSAGIEFSLENMVVAIEDFLQQIPPLRTPQQTDQSMARIASILRQ